jgi:rhodanese-related sulfurtransferase
VPERIDAVQAHALVARGVQLVDVLPRSIFDQEHLPGAISLPLEALDRTTANSALDPQKTTIVYCFDQH